MSQLKDSGFAVINKIHQSGLPLGQQQQSAKRFVENEAAKVRAEIENDPYLTQAEKTAQLATLDAMIQDVKQSIASAKDSDALEQVLVSGKQKIESVYHMGVKKDSPMPETASRVSRHAQETIGLALTASLSTFFLTKKRHDK
ncbi:Chromosome segregation ATPase Smc (Smc) [Fructobacillus fructosus]|nr:Chromosome segregation ATPase Smc (Smc) [Fructobacillus fructosus]CAK1252755.1 Chromosome segregation ATPase Smc (Smc) [Fructobacillus fructosus]CAK1252810.1 Chromosome segregation ATPase Smc (Smc) [Fructobacillus fructosus]